MSVTLRELANADLLVEPVEVAGHDATRRVLLQRGIAAALLPVVYSIVPPEPLAAQSPAAPTLTGIAPDVGARSVTVTVTLTGTNFAAGNTTVAISGSGVTVARVNVISPTSLTADFAVSGTAALGARSVTISTPAGTSGAITFSIAPFLAIFSFGPPVTFTVPSGVTSLTITASGGQGGTAFGGPPGPGGLGGSITATIDVTPGESLEIFAGGPGVNATIFHAGLGGINGGGGGGRSSGCCDGRGAGAAGGGASDVRRGGNQLVNRVIVAGGGGGGGMTATLAGVAGGAGGGLIGGNGGDSPGATGGAGGTQSAGGAGGGGLGAGQSGSLGTGGNGGGNVPAGGGGGGGGGLFGGGGGAAGGGGGGGSSWAVASARNVTSTQGDHAGSGQVSILF